MDDFNITPEQVLSGLSVIARALDAYGMVGSSEDKVLDLSLPRLVLREFVRHARFLGRWVESDAIAFEEPKLLEISSEGWLFRIHPREGFMGKLVTGEIKPELIQKVRKYLDALQVKEAAKDLDP